MRPEDFDYELPPERIAQRPAAQRGDARMLVIGPDDSTAHARARELPSVLAGLRSSPLVVRNDSRVVPARVTARRSDGRDFELLVCPPLRGLLPGAPVHAWVRGAGRLRPGDELSFGAARLRWCGRVGVDSRARCFELRSGDLLAELEQWGEVPLPPYIRREDGPTPEDRERYQTTFARAPGSVAAPTAGLHFEPGDDALDVADITLHVGPGTFLPMSATDVREHRVGPEQVIVSPAAAQRIASARAAGRPILAVGTTVVRALETVAARHGGEIVAFEGETDLVIVPGHRFAAVDLLLTNLHLPRSSLLMLVCAFGGRERILGAYREVVRAGYRFYSYGDCMLVGGCA